jgi:hypothetical protein
MSRTSRCRRRRFAPSVISWARRPARLTRDVSRVTEIL